MMRRDLYIPALEHLAIFSSCIQVDEEESGAVN